MNNLTGLSRNGATFRRAINRLVIAGREAEIGALKREEIGRLLVRMAHLSSKSKMSETVSDVAVISDALRTVERDVAYLTLLARGIERVGLWMVKRRIKRLRTELISIGSEIVNLNRINRASISPAGVFKTAEMIRG